MADPEIVSLMADRKITKAEAQLRLTWQRQALLLAAELRDRLGGTFGGVWIDPVTGRVKVGIVGIVGAEYGPGGPVARTISQLGLAGAADVFKVRYPVSQLEAADSWLGNRSVRVNASARWPLGSALRTDLNAVELQLPSNAVLTAAERAFISEARARYGDALRLVNYSSRVHATDCIHTLTTLPGVSYDTWASWCNPPLRAAITIFSSTPKGVVYCTGGFVARSRTDGKFYLFTAGHCVRRVQQLGGTGSWSTEFTDGSVHVIGSMHNFRWDSSGDMAILNVNNPRGWSPQSEVYVTAGPNTTLDTTYRISADNWSMIGQRICMGGGISGSTCGTVTALGLTETYGGVTVQNLGEANYCAHNGDSGGPVFASHTAYGLDVAGSNSNSCDNFYQGIRAAENAMNVNVTW